MEQLKRKNFQRFLDWNKSPIRSPLLLIGPRQVGKTTLLKNLAKQIGKRVFEVNFWEDTDDTLKHIFRKSGSPQKILKDLADYFLVSEINPEDDVLFIDEIQECKEAYSTLKNFKEQMKELRILVTGSYLQLFLKNEELNKLPVGCVDEFYLGPMVFSEFLENSDPLLYEKYLKLNIDSFDISEPLHRSLMEKLNEYFFTGGLPEVVFLYQNSSQTFLDRQAVRKKQNDLLTQYMLDFQKYGKSSQIKKIDKIFQNIPYQLERSADESTNRFQFNKLGKKVKYESLHWSFQFLNNAGLIIRSFIVSKIDLPFRVHEKIEERNIFKCFFFDLGLLGASLNSPLNFNLKELGSYKGYIAENFVAIMLHSKLNSELITYKKTSKTDSAEIEFLVTNDQGKAIPVEVKSSPKSLQSKSLDSFIKTFSPTQSYKMIPTSGSGLKNKSYTAIPLYMIERVLDKLFNPNT